MLSAFLCRLDPASWHSPVTNFSIVVSLSECIFRYIRFIKVMYSLFQSWGVWVLGNAKVIPSIVKGCLG